MCVRAAVVPCPQTEIRKALVVVTQTTPGPATNRPLPYIRTWAAPPALSCLESSPTPPPPHTFLLLAHTQTNKADASTTASMPKNKGKVCGCFSVRYCCHRCFGGAKKGPDSPLRTHTKGHDAAGREQTHASAHLSTPHCSHAVQIAPLHPQALAHLPFCRNPTC